MLTYSIRFKATGTQWQIDTSEQIPKRVLDKLYARVETYDQTYSRFRPDSLFSEIARKKGFYEFPDDAPRIFEFYRSLYELTDGSVTPLIGSALERAGYDADYSFISKPQRRLPKWDDVLSWHGTTLQTTRPITLDIGAAGKGYLVDILAIMLDEEKIKNYVIDASGDLRHQGIYENRVGLEHPFNPTRIIGIIDIQNESLCASATNRRTWGDDMHHIFDPATQAPVRDVVATWVIAKEAMVADGLATALFFVDPKKLTPHYDFQFVRMYADETIDYSPGLKKDLFI